MAGGRERTSEVGWEGVLVEGRSSKEGREKRVKEIQKE